jgi:hypothetical protein
MSDRGLEYSNLMMASALDRAVDVVTAARKESANGRLRGTQWLVS